jgi:DNA-binding MarR family transcriptional regulator
MKEEKLLYQIKNLNKLVVRSFVGNSSINDLSSKPTPTQMEIIEYVLNHHGSCVYQKDLENALNLRRATVCGVLQTMEKNHLIKRVVDTNDSRVKKIILHPEALKMFNNHIKQIEEIEELMINNLTQDEIEQFGCILKKMQENLKEENRC